MPLSRLWCAQMREHIGLHRFTARNGNRGTEEIRTDASKLDRIKYNWVDKRSCKGEMIFIGIARLSRPQNHRYDWTTRCRWWVIRMIVQLWEVKWQSGRTTVCNQEYHRAPIRCRDAITSGKSPMLGWERRRQRVEWMKVCVFRAHSRRIIQTFFLSRYGADRTIGQPGDSNGASRVWV